MAGETPPNPPGAPPTTTAPPVQLPTIHVPGKEPVKVPDNPGKPGDGLPAQNGEGTMQTREKPPNPPPEVTEPDWKKKVIQKLPRVLGKAARVLDYVVPTNGATLDDRPPQDDYEVELQQKAQKAIDEGADSWEIQKWWHDEVDKHREEVRKKKEGNTQVKRNKRKEELCRHACECLKDRGGQRSYQACVAKKLREKYYDPSSGRHREGGPMRPSSPTADGPRPEVSYRNGPNGYEPVESKNDPGMPSTAPVVPGAPRPDVSWWENGKLDELYEMKFPNDTDTAAQAEGKYEDILRDHGLDPSKTLNRVDVKKDCNCQSESS